MNNIEVWKDVEGYEGHYQVSSEGRIKSIKYAVDKIRYPLTVGGYKRIKLTINGINVWKYVHRLIKTAFDGPPPSDGLKYDCCHNNGRKMDNRISNLRWDSRRKNIRDKIKHDTIGKLKELEVITILRLYKSGMSIANISRLYTIVKYYSIFQIVKGKTWKHLNPRF